MMMKEHNFSCPLFFSLFQQNFSFFLIIGLNSGWIKRQNSL
ncbi:hypothetical protein GS8_3188 [Geobacillus stearothermophilus]|uniref:Uncharacterized protein n=1 Tax=Geobacillus stearothermophilus TaxID=1422 RepID=A0ABQ7HBT8_GEOSE|nr:hypothetical protein GS8_3188 [Geobacillus stearothermophilus]